MRAKLNEPIKLRQKFWMVFRVQIYIRSELQIIIQVFIGLRDDFKKDWAVSEDNCFCRVFYPSGRLHWEKRDCFVSSVRSSSGYHGLIEIRSAAAAAPTFSDFSNSSDSKVKVKVKGPNMCYIF